MEEKELRAKTWELLGLMEGQTQNEREETVEQLGQLFEQEPTDKELALSYAMGLFNLTIEQDLSGCESSVSKLSELFGTFPKNEAIALEYAKGLFNLTVDQDFSDCQSSVSKLSELFDTFPKNEAIALAYAQGLVNLSHKQDLSGRETSVSKLFELFDTFPIESIALEYAKGLVNLSAKQDLSGRESSVSKLFELLEQFPTELIALRYANGLVNLSVKQDLSGRESSVSKLSELLEQFPTELIALRYANGLFNLSNKQDLSGRESSVSKLSELCDRFPRDEGIALEYVKGLFNLSTDQKPGGVKTTGQRLKNLWEVMETIEIGVIFIRFIMFHLPRSLEDSDNVQLQEWIDYLIEVVQRFESMELEEVFEEYLPSGSSWYTRPMDKIFYHARDFEQVKIILLAFREKLEETSYATWLERLETEHASTPAFYQLTKQVKWLKYHLSVRDLSAPKYQRIGHYSSVDTLKNLLKVENRDGKINMLGRSRLYNANYMNDTQEGALLDEFLNWQTDKSEFSASSWYLMSLTTNVDHLTMWSQYGRQGKGVSLVFDERAFELEKDLTLLPDYVAQTSKSRLAIEEKALESAEEEDEPQPQQLPSRLLPYRICYFKGNNLVGDLFESEELTSIKNCLVELKATLETIQEPDDEDREFIQSILEEVRYLFKSADYQYENEIRLLTYVSYESSHLIKQDDSKFPKLYVDSPQTIQLKEVIFGPKVSHVSDYVPYIHYCDKSITVSQSQIHFR